jgi:hypothetical protein
MRQHNPGIEFTFQGSVTVRKSAWRNLEWINHHISVPDCCQLSLLDNEERYMLSKVLHYPNSQATSNHIPTLTQPLNSAHASKTWKKPRFFHGKSASGIRATSKRSALWFVFMCALFVLIPCLHQANAAQATLAWDANEPAPDGYRLFQRTEGQSYDYSAPVWSGTTTSAVVDSLTDGTDYYFVVRAYQGSDESGDSNEVSYRYDPPVVANYTITATSGPNGSISPSGEVTVEEGASAMFSFVANSGYHIDHIEINGQSVNPLGAQSYTFTSVNRDHTIAVFFSATSHSITATAGSNGSISPSGTVTVVNGSSQAFAISPNAHYHVAGLTVDGNAVAASTTYTFQNVTANHTIAAAFAIDTYTLSASAGANGTISPASASVPYGGSYTFTITPAAGYRVVSVMVDGASVGAVSTYQFTSVRANHTIAAIFTADTVNITVSAGPGGSISPSGTISVSRGDDLRLTVTANSGYEIEDLLVDNTSVGPQSSYVLESVDSNHVIQATFAASNVPPVADAGPDQTVDEAQVVTLSGLNSSASDGGIASYQWRQIQGTDVVLSDALTAGVVTFIAPDVNVEGQALVFELTVTDQDGDTDTDTAIVNVTWINMAPTAAAGSDQTVSEGNQVVLDASNSIDPDDGIAGYQWRQTGGPVVALSGSNSVSPSFTAPDVETQGASLTFELTVTDTGGLQDTDTCVVTVKWVNTAPVADAGPDQQVVEGAHITLDGSNSWDTDGTIAAYRWRQTDGTPVTLSDATSAQPVFTAPNVGLQNGSLTFELTVTDDGGLQNQDSCIVNILWENAPPNASAGPDQTVAEGVSVVLDGGNSTDPDDGIAAFQWIQTSGPSVALSDAQSESPSFTAPDVGPEGATLVFQLTVKDFGNLKSQDTCIVNVTWQNLPPVADAGEDRDVTTGSTVTLDGSGSSDSDDGIAGYSWKQTSGPSVTLSDPGAAVTSLTVPDPTTPVSGVTLDSSDVIIFELTVTDNNGLQGTDQVSIFIGAVQVEPDTTPPTIKVTDPSSNGPLFVYTSRLTIKGIATDSSGIDRVKWSNSSTRSSGIANGTTSWQVTNIPLRRWKNKITITAFDAAGNSKSVVLTVYALIRR